MWLNLLIRFLYIIVTLGASDEFSTVGQLTKIQDDAINALDTAKVDKVEGKSLILDTEIARLADVTNQTLDGLGGEATSNKKIYY